MTSNAFNKSNQQLDRPKVCKSPKRPPPIPLVPAIQCYTLMPTVAFAGQSGPRSWTDKDNILAKDENEAVCLEVKDDPTQKIGGWFFAFEWLPVYGPIVGVVVRAQIRIEGDGTFGDNLAILSGDGGVSKYAGSDTKQNTTLITEAGVLLEWGAVDDDWNASLNVEAVELDAFSIAMWFYEEDAEKSDVFLDWIEATVCASIA